MPGSGETFDRQPIKGLCNDRRVFSTSPECLVSSQLSRALPGFDTIGQRRHHRGEGATTLSQKARLCHRAATHPRHVLGMSLRVVERAGQRVRIARLVDKAAAPVLDEHRPRALVRDNRAQPRSHRLEDAAAKRFGLERGVNVDRRASANRIQIARGTVKSKPGLTAQPVHMLPTNRQVTHVDRGWFFEESIGLEQQITPLPGHQR